MSLFTCLQRQLIFIAYVLLPLVSNSPQDKELKEPRIQIKPGKYVPELYGAARGKYMPDYRGIYQHIHLPYDGGYGDRGEKYEHDISGVFKRPFSLGMRDHLRFMIDFNYNGSGWQVIQFDWVRDGDEDRQYNYVKENKLWETQSAGYDYSIGSSGSESESESGSGKVEENSDTDGDAVNNDDGSSGDGTIGEADINVHVTGEYVPNDYNGSVMQMEQKRVQDAQNIQDTLRELLDYIQTYIIPTLD